MAGPRRHRQSLCEHFQFFINDTSAHGWKYLDQHSPKIQIIFWILVLVVSFGLAFTMISSFWRESKTNPISTTINTRYFVPEVEPAFHSVLNLKVRLVTQIPFPTVAVDAGDVIDRWGFLEKYYDQFEFMADSKPFDDDTGHALRYKEMIEQLNIRNWCAFAIHRITFQKLIQEAFASVVGALREQLEPYNVTQLFNIKKFENYLLFKNYRDFSKAVAIVATLRQNYVIGRPEHLQLRLSQSLGRITDDNVYPLRAAFGDKVYTPMIDELRSENNLTFDEYRICFRYGDECRRFKVTYLYLMTPLMAASIPMADMGIGHFMQYFVRRFEGSDASNSNTFMGPMPQHNFGPLRTIHESLVTEIYALSDALMLGFQNNGSASNASVYGLNKFLTRPSDTSSPTTMAESFSTLHQCNSHSYEEAYKVYLAKLFDKGQKDQHQPIHPCLQEGINMTIQSCCNVVQFLKRLDYAQVMRMMKFSLQSPHFYQTVEEHSSDFTEIVKLRPFMVSDDLKLRLRTYNPRVFMCKYNGMPQTTSPDNCHLFTRTFSNNGLALTFNQGRFWDSFRKLPSLETFHDVMDTKLNLSHLPFKDGVLYPEVIGHHSGLDIVLRLNPHTFKDKPHQKFKVALGNPNELIDMRVGTTELDPGFSYTFHITPSRVEASKNLKFLPIEVRECRFRSENKGMILFKVSKNGSVT